MNQMKYIIVDNGMYEKPVIFDEGTAHNDMAVDSFGFKSNVVAAGFIRFTKDGLQCYGKSLSLDVESRGPEDSKLINRMIGATDV